MKKFANEYAALRPCKKCGRKTDAFFEIRTRKIIHEKPSMTVKNEKNFFLCDDCMKEIEASFCSNTIERT